MTFKTDMQAMAVNMINTVFGTEGNVSKTVTIMHPTLTTIDETTDEMITGETSFMINGILGPWVKDAIASQTSDSVKTNDQMLKVAYTDLIFLPTVDVDTVSLDDGSVYLITLTKVDAADAVMTMQLRRIKGPNT